MERERKPPRRRRTREKEESLARRLRVRLPGRRVLSVSEHSAEVPSTVADGDDMQRVLLDAASGFPFPRLLGLGETGAGGS